MYFFSDNPVYGDGHIPRHKRDARALHGVPVQRFTQVLTLLKHVS